MKYLIRIFVFFCITVNFSITGLKAQNELNQPNLRFYLSDDKSSYAGIVMVNQVWTRYSWLNPDINGDYPAGELDIGIRRSRLIFYTQLMDKVFMYTQIGTDGLALNNTANPNVSLYNAQTEYYLIKDKLHLGFGLNTWNGISRYNNSKLLEFLILDNPGFAYPVGGSFDRFGRQLGVYAKGLLNKLHYQLSLAKPFEATPVNNNVSGTRERNSGSNAWKGYFMWHFLDNEKFGFPYMTMNNLGRARLLNLGAGFYFQSEAMESTASENNDLYNVFLFATDLFLDLPIGENQAITSYLGYFNYNFGPDYIRSMSKMNIWSNEPGSSIPQGSGIQEWEVGTGQIIHWEVGYLLSKTLINNNLQPFGSLTYKDFEALDESSLQFNLGINILPNKRHNMKWTFQYSNRPVYTFKNDLMKVSEYVSQVLLQTQIWF